MSTEIFQADLLCALMSLNLRGRTSSWGIQNDGQCISLKVEWSNSPTGSIGFRPNSMWFPCSSSSGFQRKAPSTLRRDQKRMEEFAQKKQNSQRQESQGKIKSDKRFTGNTEMEEKLSTPEKVSVSVQTLSVDKHSSSTQLYVENGMQTDEILNEMPSMLPKETQTEILSLSSVQVQTTNPIAVEVGVMCEFPKAGASTQTEMEKFDGFERNDRNKRADRNVMQSKPVAASKSVISKRKTETNFHGLEVSDRNKHMEPKTLIPDESKIKAERKTELILRVRMYSSPSLQGYIYYLVKFFNQALPEWIELEDLDEAGRAYVRKNPAKIKRDEDTVTWRSLPKTWSVC